MTERGLRISEVDGWKPDDLGLDASALGRLVTKLDSLLQSMLTEQDDLAETWTGAGASAAATRVVKEQTAGSHISGKIDNIKTLLTSGQTELQGAKDFVLTKRKNFVDWGFEVDDRGIVTATEKIKQLNTAGKDRSEVISAGLELMAEAGRYTMEMLGALQHAQGVAKGVQAKLAAAKSELGALVTEQAPTKAVRDLGLVPGQSTITLPPGILPEGADPVATMVKLENGIPVTFTDKDGKTTTLTPNPDNTLTVSQSVTGPDGSTTTTASTNGGPTTTTVSTPRTDGSGIVDHRDRTRRQTATAPDSSERWWPNNHLCRQRRRVTRGEDLGVLSGTKRWNDQGSHRPQWRYRARMDSPGRISRVRAIHFRAGRSAKAGRNLELRRYPVCAQRRWLNRHQIFRRAMGQAHHIAGRHNGHQILRSIGAEISSVGLADGHQLPWFRRPPEHHLGRNGRQRHRRRAGRRRKEYGRTSSHDGEDLPTPRTRSP